VGERADRFRYLRCRGRDRGGGWLSAAVPGRRAAGLRLRLRDEVYGSCTRLREFFEGRVGNEYDSVGDVARIVRGAVADMHKCSAVTPIRFPDPGGAFPGDHADARRGHAVPGRCSGRPAAIKPGHRTPGRA
jgi:hypothetical protein